MPSPQRQTQRGRTAQLGQPPFSSYLGTTSLLSTTLVTYGLQRLASSADSAAGGAKATQETSSGGMAAALRREGVRGLRGLSQTDRGLWGKSIEALTCGPASTLG